MGSWGVPISVYDPKRNDKKTYPDIIQNQSIASLAYIEHLDLIAVGSSVRGGTGTRAVEKDPKLILWDPNEEGKVFETIPVAGARTVLSLATTKGGVLYGITDNEKIFVFDSEKREIKKVFDLGFKNPIEISLQLGPDGRFYGLAAEAIFAIDPKDDQVSLLGRPPTPSIQEWQCWTGRSTTVQGLIFWEFEIPPD